MMYKHIALLCVCVCVCACIGLLIIVILSKICLHTSRWFENCYYHYYHFCYYFLFSDNNNLHVYLILVEKCDYPNFIHF